MFEGFWNNGDCFSVLNTAGLAGRKIFAFILRHHFPDRNWDWVKQFFTFKSYKMNKPLILFGFLRGGPYYHLVGRTGNNVGRVRGGKNVFSMRPHPSSKPPTEAQLDVREQFSLIVTFLSWITSIIRVGFQGRSEGESAMNAAVSYNYRNAITGVSPNYVIDYPKMVYSKGQLSEAADPEVATTVASQVTFSWGTALESGEGSLTDLATVLVYNADKDKFLPIVGAAARSVQTYVLHVPATFTGDLLHCYISFVAVGGKAVSNSVYVGSVTVL